MVFLIVAIFAYPWPLLPQGVQHRISGTFCEYRSGPPPHFHNGVDIPLAEGGYVIASESGQVLWLSSSGSNSGIRVGRFAYVHVIPRPDLSIGDWVDVGDTIGTTNWLNHIHFKDGGGASGLPCINPLLPGNLEPFIDTMKPVVDDIIFVTDGTTNNLGDTLCGYIDILSPARDTTDPDDTNNGIYRIGYLILSEDSVPLTDTVFSFKFDTLPDNSYLNNVYSPGSNTSYYIYIPTNQLASNGYINTALFEPGDYLIEVIVSDVQNNLGHLIKRVYMEPPDTSAPQPPKLLSAFLNPQGNPTLVFSKPQDGDLLGFRIYLQFLNAPWTLYVDESVLGPNDTVYTFSEPLLEGVPFYFRVTAVDTSSPPNESSHSNTLSLIRRADGELVLYIRAGDSDTAVFIWTESIKEFNVSLESLDESFYPSHPHNSSVVLVETGMRKENVLEDTVISSLKDFVNSGGNLLISGGNIAYYLKETDSLFLYMTLGAGFAGDSSSVDTIEGVQGTVFQGIAGSLGGIEDLDMLSPLWGTAVLDYVGAPCYAGIEYNESRTLLLSFPLELFKTEVMRDSIFHLAFSNFGLVETHEHRIPYREQLFVYPNPSRGVFYLIGKVGDLEVIDVTGRIVLRRKVENIEVLDMRGFPSGVYLLKTRGKVLKLVIER